MTDNALHILKERFEAYTRSFYSGNSEHDANIRIKIEHTDHVIANCREIARGEGMNADDVSLAQAVGMMHDIGRFPQYRDYRTFRDSISCNHGELGARVIRECGLLRGAFDNEAETILNAVTYHNAFSIPKLDNPYQERFIGLIRDADKLDILRVMIEYLELPEAERASAVAAGFADEPYYSREVISSIKKREVVRISTLRSVNDFMLMQLSWLFDMNFAYSFSELLKRGLLDHFRKHLPEDEIIREVFSILEDFAASKIYTH